MNSLSKIKTIVIVLTLMMTALHPFISFADSKTPTSTATQPIIQTQNTCYDFYKLEDEDKKKNYVKSDCQDKKGKSDYDDCINKALKKFSNDCRRKETGSSDTAKEECKTAYQKYTEDSGKLSSACAGASITGDCPAHINKCIKCQGTDTNDPICNTLETEDIDIDEADSTNPPASVADFLGMGQSTSSRNSSTKLSPDPKKEALRYKNCPALAGVDLKDWMSKVKDAQTAVSDAKNKILDYTEKGSELESKLTDTQIEKQKEYNEALNQVEEIKQKMSNQLTEQKNKARQTIGALLDQLSSLDNQLMDLQKSYDDEYSVYLDAMARLDQQCYASALQKLNKDQTDVQNLVDKNVYSTSTFSSLLNQTGVASRKQAQGKVSKYFNQCKADPAFYSNVKSIKRVLESKQTSINNSRTKIKAKQNQLTQTIRDATERELPEAEQAVLTEENRLLAEQQKKIKQISLETQNALNKIYKDISINNQRLAQARNDLSVAEQTLTHQQAILNEKQKASGGIESDSHKISEAMTALTDMRVSAENVVANCGCNNEDSESQDHNHCKTACTTLVKSHDSWDPSSSITDDMLVQECSSLGSTKSSNGNKSYASPESAPTLSPRQNTRPNPNGSAPIPSGYNKGSKTITTRRSPSSSQRETSPRSTPGIGDTNSSGFNSK